MLVCGAIMEGHSFATFSLISHKFIRSATFATHINLQANLLGINGDIASVRADYLDLFFFSCIPGLTKKLFWLCFSLYLCCLAYGAFSLVSLYIYWFLKSVYCVVIYFVHSKNNFISKFVDVVNVLDFCYM